MIEEKIMVSIYCLAYNHERYIRDTLEGFIKQNTTFNYAVIIHDDASTDNTATIINEYEKKYPNIIKPIYQKENQYSKGVDLIDKYIIPKLKGKYIAICEGDDYWIDNYKLQKQFDALENNQECDMCAHNAKVFDCKSKKFLNCFPDIKKNKILSVEETIYKEGGFLPTASLFFRRELLKPMKFQKYWSIDYTRQIRGALRGGIIYLSDTMSVYRQNVPGSWTVRNNKKQRILFEKKQTMLTILNKETGYLYDSIIKKRIKKNKFDLYLEIDECKNALNEEYRQFVKELSFFDRLKIYIKAYFPLTLKIKRMMRE